MKTKVAYDITFLGHELGRSDRKTGIFRVTEEVMYELLKKDDVDLKLVGLCGAKPAFSALSCSLYTKNDDSLLASKFIDVFSSRLNLNNLYEKFYPAYLSEDFQKLSRSSIQSIYLRVLLKLLEKLDARIIFDYKSFDLLHSSYHQLPPENITQDLPRLLTVHDLIPIVTPEYVNPEQTPYLKKILASINFRRDWVVCNSEYTKQEFCEYTKMPPERTFVTPLAAASHFRLVNDPARIAATRQRYGIPEGDYFLSIATYLEPRKNLPHLIRCFFRLLSEAPNLDANLVLVGSKRFKPGETFESQDFPQFSSRVIFTGYVADEDLSTIYSGAKAFIYPSLYEGFGLPPLEAMQCGTPVITSNTTSLPEVVGDAGIMVDPKDEDALCQAMHTLLTNRTMCQELSQKGLERSHHFSWSKCAADTVEIYKKIASSR